MPNPYAILFMGVITVSFFLMLAVIIGRRQASHNSPVALHPSMSIQRPSSQSVSVASIRLLNYVPKEMESMMVFGYGLLIVTISLFIYIE